MIVALAKKSVPGEVAQAVQANPDDVPAQMWSAVVPPVQRGLRAGNSADQADYCQVAVVLAGPAQSRGTASGTGRPARRDPRNSSESWSRIPPTA